MTEAPAAPLLGESLDAVTAGFGLARHRRRVYRPQNAGQHG